MSLFVLVSILSELLLALMGRNFPQFAFSSAGHPDSLGISPKHDPGYSTRFIPDIIPGCKSRSSS